MSEPIKINARDQASHADKSSSPQSATTWNDSPLKTKLALLILLAAIGGSLIGMMGVYVHNAVLPMWLGLAVLTGGLMWLGKYWIWLPFDQLLRHLDQITRRERPTDIDPFFATRNDEIGRFAQGFNRFAQRSLRDHCEAKRLRRTLDQNVEQATRRATIQLRQMAMHDPLTGLGNRRFLEENLELLVNPSLATDTELVCIVIDMDNFKQINDSLGHAAGDDLLVLLADLIRGHKRQEDFAIRLGGDEFVVLLPGCQINRAEEFAQQLAMLFRQHTRTILTAETSPDLSMGIATLNEAMTTGRQLLEAADQNLYTAKRSGKGQVVANPSRSFVTVVNPSTNTIDLGS